MVRPVSGESGRRQLLIGQVLSFDGDPGTDENALVHIREGVIVVEDGRISWVGDRGDPPGALRSGAEVHNYGDHLVLPGFMDCHVHYPQLGVMASYGTQ